MTRGSFSWFLLQCFHFSLLDTTMEQSNCVIPTLSWWIKTFFTIWRSAVAVTTWKKCLVTSRWVSWTSRDVQILNVSVLTVCLHGRHAKAHGKLCTFHHGRDRLQTPRGHSIAGYQRFFLSLLNVQGKNTSNLICVWHAQYFPNGSASDIDANCSLILIKFSRTLWYFSLLATRELVTSSSRKRFNPIKGNFLELHSKLLSLSRLLTNYENYVASDSS